MSEPDRNLYLAVPEDTFKSFFQERLIQEVVQLYQVNLIIYEPSQEVIIAWKE
jgi:XisH protein